MTNYPARIRTWKNRTKTCCDTVSPPGKGITTLTISTKIGKPSRRRKWRLRPGSFEPCRRGSQGARSSVDGDQVYVCRNDQRDRRAKLRDTANSAGDQDFSHAARAASAGTHRIARLILLKAITLRRESPIGSTAPHPPCRHVSDRSYGDRCRKERRRESLEFGIHDNAARLGRDCPDPRAPAASRGRSPGYASRRQISSLDTISDPRMPELTEESEVLADLCIFDREGPSWLLETVV